MKACLLAAAMAVGFLAALGQDSPAAAGHCYVVQVEKFLFGELVISREERCPSHYEEPSSSEATSGPPSTVGHALCMGRALVLGVSVEEYCEDSDPSRLVTPPMVAGALKRIPLPPSPLQIQPPNGRTLVNFETNFYTDRDELTRVVNLLGQRVELRITPARFTWHFDDGASTTTASPGAPYPRLEVTHDYLRKGGVSPRVDTTYTAVFRVDGGAWQPVPGSVTVPGESVDLDVVEASPILVGYE